jgi:hypothetical protein
MEPTRQPFRFWLAAMRRRIWWRIRYGKEIGPGQWSRG